LGGVKTLAEIGAVKHQWLGEMVRTIKLDRLSVMRVWTRDC